MSDSYVVHLKNKYPGGKVMESESSIDAYDRDGNHRVALRKNGAGQWVDQSERMGLDDRFCLAPIPKESRVHKVFAGGKRGLDEKHEERREKSKSLERGGKIPSMDELKKEGYEFDVDHNVKSEPKA